MTSNAGGDGNAPLVDDFENAFQACLATLTNPNCNQIHDSDELKSSVDQTIGRFLDCAKQMECFFLQKRLYLSVHKPEQIIMEDITDLKAEIQRKDMVLAKYQDKIGEWQAILNEQAPIPTPGLPQHQMPPGIRGQIPNQMMPGGPSPMGGMPMRPPMGPQGPQQMPPQMGPQSGHMGPHGHGPPYMGPGVHPHHAGGQSPAPGPPQHGPPPSALQGPLSFLERTTANIGMPDPRR